jgi:hypothetical protein
MKFSEVMVHFDYKMSNIARALNIGREAVSQWKDNDEVPYGRQCELEILTKGKLKADLVKETRGRRKHGETE